MCRDEKILEVRLVKARAARTKSTVIFNSAGMNITQILLRIIANYSLYFPNSKLLQNLTNTTFPQTVGITLEN